MAKSEQPRLISHEIIVDVTTIPQRRKQTNRQTDRRVNDGRLAVARPRSA